MATATELLRLIIDADAKGAVTEMEKVGVVADKSLGKTDDKLKRVGASMVAFGAGLATAGAVAGAGLYKLAQMSEDAEMQSRKLANSIANSDQVFRSNGDALRDQAQALQQVTAADADAVIGAQSMLVQFGMTERQVSSLTPLMVDLSRKMGVDFDTAAKAIGKSVEGSSGALKKMGIVVDEARFAVDPFAATVDALRGTVGGFAEQEGKTFNGQLEILKNNLGDLGESVGGGAAEVLGGITEKLADMAHYLGDVNPQAGETVGKFAAIGSIAAVGVGALSMFAGQFIKMREAFTVVNDGVRSVTNLGKAVGGLAAVGTAAAAFVALDQVMRSVTERAEDVAAGIDRMRAASSQSQALQALADQSKTLDGSWENLLETGARVSMWFGGANSGFTDVEVSLAGVTREVGDIEQALGQLASGGNWDELTLALDALESSGVDLEASGLDDVIDRYRERVDAAAAAADAAAGPTGELGGELSGVGDEAEKAGDAFDEYAKTITGSLDAMVGVADAADDLTRAQLDVMKATGKVNALQVAGKAGTSEYAEAVGELDQANRDAARSAIGQQQAIQKLAADVVNGTVSAESANRAIRDMASAGQITAQQAQFLAGAVANATSKMQDLGQQNPRPTVSADISRWGAAVAMVDGWRPAGKYVEIGARANLREFSNSINDLKVMAHSAGVTLRAAGGPVSPNDVYIVGEKGPELFVSDKAGTIIPNHAFGSPGRVGGQMGGVSIVVNTLSSQGVESAVLDALARANRSGLSSVPGVR